MRNRPHITRRLRVLRAAIAAALLPCFGVLTANAARLLDAPVRDTARETPWLSDLELLVVDPQREVSDEEIRQRPEHYVKVMRADLRQGRLSDAGALAELLSDRLPDEPEVRAVLALRHASRNELLQARRELSRLTGPYTQTAVCAEALALRQEGRLEGALETCKRAINLDSSHPYPWNLAGSIRFRLGDDDAARASFLRALEAEPAFWPAYVNLGAVAFTRGEVEEALAYYDKALNLAPGDPGALYGRALALKEQGLLPPALEALQAVIKANPEHQPALREQAGIQLRAGLFDEAGKTARALQALDAPGAELLLAEAELHAGRPEAVLELVGGMDQPSPHAAYLYGYALMLEQDYRAALQEMNRLLEENPDNTGAYVTRAGLLIMLGEPLAAEEDLSPDGRADVAKLVEYLAACAAARREDRSEAHGSMLRAEGIVPGFSLAGIDEDALARGLASDQAGPLALGVLYYFRNMPSAALAMFDEILEQDANAFLASYWAGMACLDHRNPLGGREYLERSAASSPRFFAALFPVGELYMRSGETAKSTEFYERALAVKDDAGLRLRLGLAYEQAERLDDAAKQYDAMISLTPDLFVGYNQLAWLYARQGIQLDKALELAQKADELQPGNASILDTLGWIRFHQQEYEEAEAFLEKALTVRPNDPGMLYHLGAVVHAGGERDTAKEYLEKALAASSDFDEAPQARALLEELER